MISVWVYDLVLDEELFVYQSPAAPRAGEEIEYSFAAHDEAEWSPESWAHEKRIGGKTFEVMRVSHKVRRNSISTWGTPRVVAYVRESK